MKRALEQLAAALVPGGKRQQREGGARAPSAHAATAAGSPTPTPPCTAAAASPGSEAASSPSRDGTPPPRAPGPFVVLAPGSARAAAEVECVEILGSGSFGTVWLGTLRNHALATETPVAVKVFDEAPNYELRHTTFMHEYSVYLPLGAHAGGAPFLPRLLAHGVHPGALPHAPTPWLAMELLGLTLFDQTARAPLPRRAFLRVARSALDALEGLHASGFVHNDVKPENLCTRPGDPDAVVLCDVGLATGWRPPRADGRGGVAKAHAEFHGTYEYGADRLLRVRRAKPAAPAPAAAAAAAAGPAGPTGPAAGAGAGAAAAGPTGAAGGAAAEARPAPPTRYVMGPANDLESLGYALYDLWADADAQWSADDVPLPAGEGGKPVKAGSEAHLAALADARDAFWAGAAPPLLRAWVAACRAMDAVAAPDYGVLHDLLDAEEFGKGDEGEREGAAAVAAEE